MASHNAPPSIHRQSKIQSATDSMKMGCTSELNTRRRMMADMMMDSDPNKLEERSIDKDIYV